MQLGTEGKPVVCKSWTFYPDVQRAQPRVQQRWRRGERREGRDFQLEARLESQCPARPGSLLPSLAISALETIQAQEWKRLAIFSTTNNTCTRMKTISTIRLNFSATHEGREEDAMTPNALHTFKQFISIPATEVITQLNVSEQRKVNHTVEHF